MSENRKKRGIVFWFACQLAAGAVLTGSLGAVSARADSLVLGVAGSLSGSNAAEGEHLKHGSEAAVADLNKKGGLLGQQVELFFGDDAGDPRQAVAVANQMVNHNVIGVIGHLSSGASIPASSVYGESGIIMISPSSTNPMVTDGAAEKGFNTIFRVSGRDDVQGRVIGDYLAKKFAGKNIAIIHDKQAYGKGLADQAKKVLNDAGQTEVLFDSISPGERDFSALVSKLKAAKVDAVLFGGYYAEGGLLIRQAREQGLTTQFVAGDALNNTSFWEIAGDAANGTLFTFPPDPRKLPDAQPVLQELKAKGDPAEGYTLYAYAAVQVYACGAEKAKSTNGQDIAKVLKSGEPCPTTIGPIAFDEKGDVKQQNFVFFEWRDGKYNQLPDVAN
ncbi:MULTISPECIES: branched-chain amino acid ABC transporter substrate-binding protein [unclassified Mesorhizobium]|uniref:branched-chain amino acid ABC transporter substrate-binding protein n=1 Tax=unclassified Mesorhizobium TaxID=325217 RepID=UPI001092F32B|nr:MULTISPECIES: branched-chain amino acid ABC transporter substrate-binding protein [unclassified Mesorhizobium]TGS43763.1 branched-chain amino acid ABC transporter substrate-binding protein [Mesorhizobium sp. M8A.F.Ca.ET.182.01.1.1]TGS78344.1 branched-chain amino acid ABC transporter substrate-binding protein [Mesorhizobium sp. M8A.F.Ca.ET.181.01.1.1]TGV15482.1 branched-chain amino acid ABC transporter substrate-binding protein [Mesorhizobium sp. M8A.F.Ca.ET.173.01.1.1]